MSIDNLILRLEKLQGCDQYVGKEKRNQARLVYPPSQRPTFKTGKYKVEVVDISEIGLRFFNYLQHNLGPEIQGVVEFNSGITYEVKGDVVWKYQKELGLILRRIPHFIFEQEIEHLLKYLQKECKQ